MKFSLSRRETVSVRTVLSLLEEFGEPNTTVEELLSGGVQVRTELGESGDFTVLGELEFHRAGDLLHGLRLGGGTYTRDGETDVDGWTDTLVEELGLQEDLSVGDGDYVGGDVGGYVSSLCLDDGQGSKRTTAESDIHLGRSLEETRVKVEHITGVGLTTWRSPEEKRHLTIGNGLLRQIVVDNEGVLAVVPEEFTHGTARVWGEVLEWSSVRGRGRDNDCVAHSTAVRKTLDNLRDGGTLLTDSNVYAVKLLLLVAGVVETLLVYYRVNGESGLASLSVADDQLTLTTTDRHERVDGLDAGLHGLPDRLPEKIHK